MNEIISGVIIGSIVSFYVLIAVFMRMDTIIIFISAIASIEVLRKISRKKKKVKNDREVYK